METIDCIKTRRSKRKYLNKEIPKEIIEKLIDSARHAPYGGPLKTEPQLWEFIIIDKQEIKDKLALTNEDRQFVKTAPIIIAVCADKNRDPKYKNWEITTGLAIQNLLLTAHNLGLGACFVSAFSRHEEHTKNRELLRKVLEIPEHVDLIAIIPVGYPDPEEKIEEKPLRDIKEIIHYNRF